MTALTVGFVPAHLAEQVAHAKALLRAQHAQSTRRAYAADLMAFKGWADEVGLEALPASPDTVVLFLSAQAGEGKRPSTLQRRLAAIRHLHREAGHTSPTDTEMVSACMAGIRRTLGVGQRQTAPATSDRVLAMLDTCGNDPAGKRDRLLIALGFGGAFRRSELVGLRVEDLEESAEGLKATIRRSKTDQEGAGQVVPILDGPRLQIKAALHDWLAVGVDSGPIFRRLLKGGGVTQDALTDRSVADIIKHRARLAGLDPALFSGHSLRAGFLTSAAASGASVWKMAEVSRHRKIETLRGYVRNAELFKQHAGAAFM
jgi:site-specific recombinase XerD